MNLERRVFWIGRFMALLLILVSMRAAYWQLWRGLALDPVALDPVAAQKEYARLSGLPTPEPGAPLPAPQSALAQLPQPVIQRTIQLLSNIERGTIYDRNGNALAKDSGRPGEYQREYADPSLAHTVGYVSALRAGVAGLEATYNRDLLGLNRADTQIDRMLHRPIRGSDLVLTLDSSIQQAAAQALGDQAGSAVVLDGKTGAVLAMVSSPTFDPNRINDPEYANTLLDSTALINRATQALYTPGSIFKTVTLIAALDTRQVSPKTVFDFGKARTTAGGKPYYVYEVDGGLIIDRNHKENRLSLEMCYVTSANAAFAKMADEMEPDVFIDYGQRLGFSTPDYTGRFPLELPVSEPQLANDLDSLRSNNLLRASTGYGQGELLTTPLNMAMVVEAVVNNGTIPVPYFVESIKDPQGGVIRSRPNKHEVRGIMSRQTAGFVRQSMEALVTQVFGGKNFVPGAVAGGKTGTAQLGGEANPHSWFIGFAEKGDQVVVIAVIVENARPGANRAIPVFQQIANVALGQNQ